MIAHVRGRRRAGAGARAPRGGRDPADRRARGLRVRVRARLRRAPHRASARRRAGRHASTATSRSSSTAAWARARAWPPARSAAPATTPTRWTAGWWRGRSRACRSSRTADTWRPIDARRAAGRGAGAAGRRARVRRARAGQARRLPVDPVHVASPPNDARVFVVEQGGLVKIVGGGTFLDISGRHAERQRARPALDRVRAGLRHERTLLRVPDARPSGDVEVREYGAGRRSIARRCSTSRTRPRTTTAASSSSGRTARSTRASATTPTPAQRPDPSSPFGKIHRIVLGDRGEPDLVVGAAQPVALQLRPCHRRPADRRRRRRSRTRRSTGRARPTPARASTTAGRATRARQRCRRLRHARRLLARRTGPSARSSAATSSAIPACRR